MDPCEAFSQYVADQLRRLRRQIPGILEGKNPESVHRARVACRRLRVVLQHLRQNLPRQLTKGWKLRRLRRDIRDFAQALGDLRDIDVHIGLLETWAAEEGQEETSPAYPDVVLLFRRLRLARLRPAQKAAKAFAEATTVNKLQKWAKSLRQASLGGKELRQLVTNAELGLQGDLSEATQLGARIVENASAADIHELRIAFKRLRYTLELWSPVFPGQLDSWIERCQALQEAVGQVCDSLNLERQLAGLCQAATSGPKPISDVDDSKKIRRSLEVCLRLCREKSAAAVAKLQAWLTQAGSEGFWEKFRQATRLSALERKMMPTS